MPQSRTLLFVPVLAALEQGREVRALEALHPRVLRLVERELEQRSIDVAGGPGDRAPTGPKGTGPGGS